MCPAPRSVRGFTLLDVLVAIFVLAVGLLGVGGLQLTAKRANHEAMQRATASALAADIVERMRANPGQLGAYTDGGLGRTLTGTTLPAQSCAAGCTPAQLALLDLYEWEQALAGVTEQRGTSDTGGLALPTACVTGPDGGAGQYTVAIAWRGLTRLSNPTLNACGEGSGRYDHGDGGFEADVYRRLLVIQTYISPPL